MSEMKPDSKYGRSPSTKPEGRFVLRQVYHADCRAMVRVCMRLVTALEEDPVNLEKVMADLRVLEDAHRG